MKALYNEGRVSGLSSYELYVRQALAADPDANIMTEAEWLGANLARSNSMILKIAAGTTAGYHDYVLPENSALCSCTWLSAHIFEGDVTVDESGHWAIRVDDYGRLISNTYIRGPQTPGTPSYVPVKEDYMTMSDEYIDQCKQFMKISTGLMFQPGEWVTTISQEELCNEAGVPLTTEDGEVLLADVSEFVQAMKLDPDLAGTGFVRILIRADVTKDFYIMLHGFSNKTIISITGPSTGTDHPENGDFLGPQTWPWAVPITFTYTNDVMQVFADNL